MWTRIKIGHIRSEDIFHDRSFRVNRYGGCLLLKNELNLKTLQKSTFKIFKMRVSLSLMSSSLSQVRGLHLDLNILFFLSSPMHLWFPRDRREVGIGGGAFFKSNGKEEKFLFLLFSLSQVLKQAHYYCKYNVLPCSTDLRSWKAKNLLKTKK